MAAGFVTIDENNKLPAAVQGELNTTFASIDEQGRQPVRKDELVFNVRDYGAVGDGVTDDRTAINAAINAAPAGSVIFFPPGAYAYSGIFAVGKSLIFRGDTAKVISIGASVINWLDLSGLDMRFEGISFDANGSVQTLMLNCGPGVLKFVARRNTFTGPGAVAAIRLRDTPDVTIDDSNVFDGVTTAIYGSGKVTGKIKDNIFRNWSARCLYMDGTTAGGGTLDLEFSGNHITDLTPGGPVRHPVQFIGIDSDPHIGTKVKDNYIVGPGKAYTAADPGTADQISLHRCVDFEVTGNYSRGGGDMGITVSQQSKRGVVANNICIDNDASGITIGSGASTTTDDISVYGNVTMNNGWNRNGTVEPAGRCGIRVRLGHGIALSGNTTGDDQTVATQQYGISITDSDVQLGSNMGTGNAISLYQVNGVSTAAKVPHSLAAGKDSMTLLANTIATKEVTFPPGRFTVPPVMTPVVIGGSLTDPVAITAASITPTGCTLTARSPVDRTIAVHWVAVQMGPDSFGG